VKVDKRAIDEAYATFRAIAIATVHREIASMGQSGEKTVEVGLISFGSTAPDRKRREVSEAFPLIHELKSLQVVEFDDCRSRIGNA